MAKRKKTTATKSLWTSDEKERYEQGLRALARLIARAYLCDRGIRKTMHNGNKCSKSTKNAVSYGEIVICEDLS